MSGVVWAKRGIHRTDYARWTSYSLRVTKGPLSGQCMGLFSTWAPECVFATRKSKTVINS